MKVFWGQRVSIQLHKLVSAFLLPHVFFQQILPGVRIIIANPETKGPLGDSHLGEVSHESLTFLCSELNYRDKAIIVYANGFLNTSWQMLS